MWGRHNQLRAARESIPYSGPAAEGKLRPRLPRPFPVWKQAGEGFDYSLSVPDADGVYDARDKYGHWTDAIVVQGSVYTLDGEFGGVTLRHGAGGEGNEKEAQRLGEGI